MKVLETVRILTNDFYTLSIDNRILFCSLGLMLLNIFHGLAIFPFVFNFKIIPEIENKVGCKLEYSPYYNIYLFNSYFARYGEIAIYIFTRYYQLPHRDNKEGALSRVKYSREEFSKKEIFWSTYVIINFWVFFINFLICLIIKKYQEGYFS